MVPWSAEWKALQLELLYDEWKECERCPLHETRKHVVFGEGNPDADVMFIGEAPGEAEDESGSPFDSEGRSGDLFNSLWSALDQSRDDVFITNVIGCRPPENRDPIKVERESCGDRLRRLVYIVDPLVIVTLGKVAMQSIMRGRAMSIEREHGRLFSPGMKLQGRVFPRTDENKVVHELTYDVIPLYHPSYILRMDSYDEKTDTFSKGGIAEHTLKDMGKVIELVQNVKAEYNKIRKSFRRRE
jgi:DNA polymerase